MPFTDDNLKHLKEAMTILPSKYYGCTIRKDEMEALIARLEAAEANMGGHSWLCENSGGQCSCTKDHRRIAWRKAAGKS